LAPFGNFLAMMRLNNGVVQLASNTAKAMPSGKVALGANQKQQAANQQGKRRFDDRVWPDE
jgi:hypothetical protein